MSNATRQIARAAGTVMFAFVLNSLMGLLRQILITRAFGTDAALDAFYAASRLPEILFSLIAGGALASAFIPTFTGYLENQKTADAWQLASSVANLVAVALTLISALAWFFAPQLVGGVLVPQFDPAQQALTVELLRIQLLTPVIFGLSGLLMGVLNANQRFFLPALAPSMLWLGIILSIFIFVPSMGIHGLAWGAVLGAVLHLGVQLPALLRLRPSYSPTLGLRLPGVRQVGRLMAPRLLGVAVVQLNFLVNTIVASGMASGSLAAITVAFSVMLMPQQAIGQAIAIAALPTFSAQFARGNLAELRSSLVSTLRGILFLALPASIGLILLRQPVVALLFQRGQFGPDDTQLVAWALLWYAAGLVGHSIVEIASRAFYALQDTRTPVLVGVGAMGLNVVLSLTLPGLFARAGLMPHGGLALANSAATFIEMLVLLWLMRGRLGGLEESRLLGGAGQSALASLAMLAALLGWLATAAARPLWLQAAGGIAIGLAVYAAAAWLLRVPELASVLAQARARLKR
ncbi:MAG: murein biosynthesis integral membrane protein MurJ [Anaerolineales bacterium]|nr:MAG: murein biosynthesis integral membrane protein MurJ [Anaerolineales bacterium]